MWGFVRGVGGVGGAGVVAVLLASAGGALAQCPQFLANESFVPRGMQAGAAIMVHDLDGAGPLAPEVLMGMRYLPRPTDSAPVLRWDGTRFRAIPGRLSNSANNELFADLEVHNGELYVGGRFDRLSNVALAHTNIARLVGGRWQGLPVSSLRLSGSSSDIIDMRSDGGSLYVVGQNLALSGTGGGPTLLGSWSGSNWTRSVPTTGTFWLSLAVAPSDGALAFANTAGSALLLQSFSAGVATPIFSGSVGSCVPNTFYVREMGTIDGNLYACGQFFNGPPQGSPANSSIFVRNATGGWDNVSPDSSVTQVFDVHGLVSYGGQVVAYGSNCARFARAASRPAQSGGPWAEFALPVSARNELAAMAGATVFENQLVMVGSSATSGVLNARSIYVWDGTSWRSPGASVSNNTSASVFFNDLAFGPDGDLYFGGGLVSHLDVATGTTAASAVAKLDLDGGTGWGPVGNLPIADMAQVDEVLWWGDRFVVLRRGTANALRIWNGTTWSNPIAGFSGMPQAMAVFQGNLVVAFSTGVRSFDGASWTALSATNPPQAFDGSGVGALAVYQGQLVATGFFTGLQQPGGTLSPRNRVVRWTGADWENFTPSIAGTPRSLLVRENDLYVGGVSLTAGGLPSSVVYRWDGAQWSNVGATTGEVTSMAWYKGSLYGVQTPRLRRFDAASGQWVEPVASVFYSGTSNQDVRSLVVDAQGEYLHFAGGVQTLVPSGNSVNYAFTYADGYGRFYDGPPIVDFEPQNTSVPAGQTLRLSVDGPWSSVYPTFQWKREGVALADGALASGAIVSGASGPWLSIQGATPDESGLYECVVSYPCGSTTVGAIVVVASPLACDGVDFNQDGDFPTPLDLEDFINAVAGNVCPTCSSDLDFNNDGDFPTPLDVEAFISVSAGGPCLR